MFNTIYSLSTRVFITRFSVNPCLYHLILCQPMSLSPSVCVHSSGVIHQPGYQRSTVPGCHGFQHENLALVIDVLTHALHDNVYGETVTMDRWRFLHVK